MPPSQRGTGFINWDQFVNANRGATDATVAKLVGGVQGAGQRAEDSLGFAMEDFERNLGASTLRFDPNSEKDWEELSRYVYDGPEGVAGDQNFQYGLKEAQRATKDSAALANPYGRQEMLRQQFGAGNPRYSAGQQRFDSAITGTAGRGKFEQLQQDFKGLLPKYNQAAATTAQQAGQAKKDSAEAARQYAAGRPTPTTPAPQNPHSDPMEEANRRGRTGTWGGR
jgi:uncharacterized phage infection (PIP) family protein YhgE